MSDRVLADGPGRSRGWRSHPGVAAAVAVGVLAAAAMLLGCAGGPPVEPAAPPTAAAPSSSPAPGVTSTTPPDAPAPVPGTPAPTTPANPPAAERTLRLGAEGPDVLAVQRRLRALGFWLGAADGRYGGATMHAVTAFQKTAGLRPDGITGSQTRQALREAARATARSRAGRVIEVDLRRQVILVVRDGVVEWVVDTSTGRVPGSTPTGRFTVYRQIDGYHQSPLGVLYRPRYVVGGVAVHGYPSVPPYPASHGCIRVINAAMDWIWATDAMPIGRPVWIY